MPAPKEILDLIERFDQHLDAYRNGTYKEAQLRQEFLDPFFKALGWDMDNTQGYAEAYKEVIHEDAVKIGDFIKAPDYSFRIGGTRKFFVEAKKPSVYIKGEPEPAFQLRRYAWSGKLPLSILTDFEEFAVYDCRVRPSKSDKADKARINYWTYKEYADKWDEIAAIFSRDAVLKGSFDKYATTAKGKKGTAAVDAVFLDEIESWRESLAKNIAQRNPELSQKALNYAVQQTIDRVIFLRICEDRGIEPYGQLRALQNGANVYKRLTEYFRKADERYNSGLFHFHKEQDRAEEPDRLTLGLDIDDKPLKEIFQHLYYPDSPYEFSVLGADILGSVYEQFLGKVIRLTEGHHAKIEEKPEVKKAGGVYYTPTYIVGYIVKHTVGKLLEGKTPKQVEKLRILDPACGSGSFLIGAYQFLLDWHRDWYEKDGAEKHAKGKQPKLYQGKGGVWRLTTNERKRILTNNIYGVDIDSQAVEVTKLSLLLKVLEGESDQTLQTQLFHERVLPDLGRNIKCGNSLIGPDFYETVQLDFLDDNDRARINVFDWEKEFSEIMQAGGFDVVIGNPPYIDSEWMTEFYPKERTYFTGKYAAATGNWDIFCVFIERGMQLCRNNGLASMIVPNKLGSASYASGARSVLTENNELLRIRDYSSVHVFPVSVYPIVYVAQKKKPQGASPVNYERVKDHGIAEEYELDYSQYFLEPKAPWRIFSNLHAENPAERLREAFPELRSVAKVLGAATVSEAYDIQPLIEDGNKAATSLKLINSGTIDRYRSLWGNKECRYLGKSFLCPVVGTAKANKLPIKRREQADTPKVIVAGMTKVLECYPDLKGEYLAGKSTSIVLSDLDIRYLSALLNSKLMSFYYDTVFGGNKLAGGYLRIGPPQLGTLPIKVPDLNNSQDRTRHDHMVSLVESMLALNKQLAVAKTPHEQESLKRQIDATDRQINKLVYELYGLTDEEIKIVEGEN